MERKYTAEDVKVWTTNEFGKTLTATFTDGRKETVSMSFDRRVFPALARAACINQANSHPNHPDNITARLMRENIERMEREYLEAYRRRAEPNQADATPGDPTCKS